jgi:hypothetical protein
MTCTGVAARVLSTGNRFVPYVSVASAVEHLRSELFSFRNWWWHSVNELSDLARKRGLPLAVQDFAHGSPSTLHLLARI